MVGLDDESTTMWKECVCNYNEEGGVFPKVNADVMRLKCGGFIFILHLNHTMSDVVGLVHSMQALGEIARGAHEPSVLLVWSKVLLNARE